MKKIMAILMLRLIGVASLAFATVGIAMAQPPVYVGVYAEHYGGKLVYHYSAANNSTDNIASVRIGYDIPNDTWELLELPSGWNFDMGIPPASATSPPGWRVYMITPEEIPENAVAWGAIDEASPRLLPGQTLTGMSITLDKADANYLTAHAVVNTTLTVPMQRLDTTPPTLSVTLSPKMLWPPNEKLVSVTATITVKDDYDPAPEIQLVSIMANEVLDKDDIKAKLGIDDRHFQLKAEREGKNKAGRIYTVTYSATDGSGNKTLASATVTVPHDRDDKEPQKSPDSKDNKKGGGAMLMPFTK